MTRAKVNDMIRRTQTYAILNAGRIDTPGCSQLSTYDRLVWKVRLQADPDNTASVFVGNQMKHPYELIPGAELEIPIDFLYKIYVRITAGDAVNWWAMGSTAQISRYPSAYTKKVADTGPIAYWTQGDALLPTAVDQINSPAQDGTYTGVVLGQQGIGDGLASPLYDGAADYADVFSAALAAAFDGSEGSLSCWVRVSGAGVWTDGITRRIAAFGVDAAANVLLLEKRNVNNTLRVRYVAGGVGLGANIGGQTTTDFFHFGMTWSLSAGATGEMRAYVDGVQAGATYINLGAWVGAIVATRSVIGATTTAPANPWDGTLAHCALWDRALTPAEMADIATV